MNQLTAAASPHIRSGISTTRIMADVLIALCPALIAGVVIFGWRALLLTAVCVAACVLFEYLARLVMKRERTIGDLSAAVTGVLLAFNLPVSIPLWIAVIGCFIAIVIVKQLFGGIGQNFANPAITARIILLVSFTAQMTHWVEPFYYRTGGIDAMSSATPLQLIADPERAPALLDLFLGNKAGCIGEISGLALLLGGIYLIIRRVISVTTPLVYLGTVFLFAVIFDARPVYQLLSGGLLLGAFFMATDYSTTPVTELGKVIFGFGCGLLTILIRVFGSYPEGVSFAILFMNILTPYLDKVTALKPIGLRSTKPEQKGSPS